MDDPVENAIVINALQRHAAVVVQKSLAAGFGLTVAEATWKSRPVVVTAVGGIRRSGDPVGRGSEPKARPLLRRYAARCALLKNLIAQRLMEGRLRSQSHYHALPGAGGRARDST